MKKYIYILLVVIILGVMGLGCVVENPPTSYKVQTLERDLARMQGDMEFYKALQYNMTNRMIDLEVKVGVLENKLKQYDGK